MLHKSTKIFVTGHTGLVGSALIRRLKFYGFKNIITRTKKELDLRSQAKVQNFFKKTKIDAVIMLQLKSEVFMLIIFIKPILFMIIY